MADQDFAVAPKTANTSRNWRICACVVFGGTAADLYVRYPLALDPWSNPAAIVVWSVFCLIFAAIAGEILFHAVPRMREASGSETGRNVMSLLLLSGMAALITCWLFIPGLQPGETRVLVTLDTLDEGMLQLAWGNALGEVAPLRPSPQPVQGGEKTFHRLEIVPLGTGSTVSRGEEVWLLKAVSESGDIIPPNAFSARSSWETSGGSAVYKRGEKDKLVWEGAASGLRVSFLKHPWSGRVLVRWNNSEKELNLFGEVESIVELALGPRSFSATLPAGAGASELALRFGSGNASGTLFSISVDPLDAAPPSVASAAGMRIDSNARGHLSYRLSAYPAEVRFKGLKIPKNTVALYYWLSWWTGLFLFFSYAVVGSYFYLLAGRKHAGSPEQRAVAARSELNDGALIAAILLLTSIFLVLRIPISDSGTAFDVAKTQLLHGTDTHPPTSLPDRVFAIGKDGNAHYIAEYAIIGLYLQLARAGRFLDDHLGAAHSWWSAELAFVQLPHCLILPLTGFLIFAITQRLGASRSSGIWAALLGLASTIIPYYAAPYTRDGLGLPVSTAVFYTALRFRQSDSPNRWVWALAAGSLAGVSVLLKMTAGAIAIPACLYIGLSEVIGERRINWRSLTGYLTLVAVPVALAVAALFFRNWLTFGIFSGLPDAKPTGSLLGLWLANPFYLGLHGLLFSPSKGVFWYCPVAWLLFISWGAFRKAWPLEAMFFLVHLVILLALVVPFSAWHGDFAWGPRYLLTAIPWMLIVVAYWLARSRTQRSWAYAIMLAVAGFFVQLPALTNSLTAYFRLFTTEGQSLTPGAYYWVPSLSPIVVHWKILLSFLSNGRFFGDSLLGFGPEKAINFGSWYWPRETFWNEVVTAQWHLGYQLGAVIIVTLVVLMFLLLGRSPLKLLRLRRSASTLDEFRPQPQQVMTPK